MVALGTRWDERNEKDKKDKVKLKVLVAQSCLTLSYTTYYSSPVSSVHGILQAGILE